MNTAAVKTTYHIMSMKQIDVNHGDFPLLQDIGVLETGESHEAHWKE